MARRYITANSGTISQFFGRDFTANDCWWKVFMNGVKQITKVFMNGFKNVRYSSEEREICILGVC